MHIDIEFEKHPCHLLGLDYVDYIGSHTNDVKEGLKYYIPTIIDTFYGKIPHVTPFKKDKFKVPDQAML